MVLGRKGLTCGAIKGLTVCRFTYWAVFVLHCKHTALHSCAWRCLANTRSWQVITGRGPVIDS
ncbi:unnamed protein product [Staurois parvus]|uniref:Uncharacterized protein n=1 Tax=Staurois parvus TaxID=386267 RepID=A0ABN9BP28_9NEOB|nr:unnamed protein product [Staurois parvus]